MTTTATASTQVSEGFVKQNWLLATMGTLVFVFGGIAGHAFDSRIVTLEQWKNETDVSRATRTAELRMEIVRAQERIASLQKWVDEDHSEVKHLHEDIDKMLRGK